MPRDLASSSMWEQHLVHWTMNSTHAAPLLRHRLRLLKGACEISKSGIRAIKIRQLHTITVPATKHNFLSAPPPFFVVFVP